MTKLALILAILAGLNLIDRSNFNGRLGNALHREAAERFAVLKAELGY